MARVDRIGSGFAGGVDSNLAGAASSRPTRDRAPALLKQRGCNLRDSAVDRGFDRIARPCGDIELRRLHQAADDFCELGAWIRPRRPRLALDLACGTARIARRVLARRAQRVFALDCSNEMLKGAGRFGPLPSNLFLVRGAVESLPFQDGHFDLLTCGYAFSNIRDSSLALSEFARVLAPSGYLALMEVIAPADPSQCDRLNQIESMRNDFYARIRTYVDFLDDFRRANLRVEACEFHDGPQLVSDWLDLSPVAESPVCRERLLQALLDLGEKAGLRPRPSACQRAGGHERELEIHYQTAWFLLRHQSAL